MNIGDIISDALVYPLNNIKALILYIVIGIIAAIVGGTVLIDVIGSLSTTGMASVLFEGLGIVSLIVFILLLFLVEGYALDIIKYGIERRADGPGIDLVRQISNAVKLIVVDVVYYIVPVLIIFILGLFLRDWLISIIALILFVIFALANFMAKCRLAKTDNLGEALAIGQAIGDISRVGIVKLIATAVLVFVIAFIIVLVIGVIGGINDTIGDILFGIASVYLIFFYHRAIGLLYSDV